MLRTLMTCGLLALPCVSSAQGAFVGTWRPDPQRPSATAKPTVIELTDGAYECLSCSPSYKVLADGADHLVSGSQRYDTLSVAVLDERTVHKIARKEGKAVADTMEVVSSDGSSKTQTQVVTGILPRPAEVATTYSRIASGPIGSHAVSGEWREIQTDLTHHEEDTTYTVNGNTLTMTDKLGRSFSATLDGREAPYRGDPQFTSVSVQLIDSRTLQEYDKKDGKVVQINRWSIDPDGTMRALFDDTRGHVQKQIGHKVP